MTDTTELLALPSPGTPAFVEAMRRAWDRGWAVLPLDPRLPPDARAALLERLRPTHVVEGDDPLAVPGRHRDGVPVLVGDRLVVATSGSTGAPRGIVHTEGSIEASARAVSAGLGVDASTDAWLCCLPLAHVAGLSILVRAWTADVPLELQDGFDPAEVERSAREGGATLVSAVPTMLERFDPSLFRAVLVGGAAMPASLPENAVASYGMTETGGAVALDGAVVEGADIGVADGEVWVRGPMVGRAERAGDDPAGRRLTDDDGWLHTDDEGEVTPDGRLRVHGRRGDVIVTGGEKVWPAPVEARLAEHPAVAEVAVVGRTDPEWGQAVTAVVVPADSSSPPSLDDLRVWAKHALPAYAAPRSLELVDALPRASLGKVQRRDV